MRLSSVPAGLVAIAIVLAIGASTIFPTPVVRGEPAGGVITGRLLDTHGEPVAEAHISVVVESDAGPVVEAVSQPDGTFSLYLDSAALQPFTLEIRRHHFETIYWHARTEDLNRLQQEGALHLPDQTLPRTTGPAFWIATLLFIVILLLIAMEKLHNTLAVLLSVSILFAVTYIGGTFRESLYILDFEGAIRYIDFEVIFLIMGMMIFIAIVEGTGVFQWLAYLSYRLSRGRAWLLAIILMVVTAVASAFLDNVTTMLLIAPITVEIALTLGMSPLPLLIPEVLASNVGGVATLVGTPTNILIGSYANISFGAFLVELTPGVLVALAGLMIYLEIVYFREYRASSATTSPVLLKKLAEDARITQPGDLRKAGVVGVFMLIFFLFGDYFHLVPAVTALAGSSVLLLWVRPDIESMIEAVDWTTLVFFMGLFILVGAVQEVGAISAVADIVAKGVGTNLTLAWIVVLWTTAVFSSAVDNIPFTAAMLPVAGFLTKTIPGAENQVIYFALAMGAAFGGHGTLIGSSANLVTAGIARQAGYPITYGEFLRKGFPALIITTIIAMIWLAIRF
ncbi:MAG: citrate transporter [Chloroflexi bacterium]|nr:citrate transporter [Chloroflexota bacterium]